MISLLEPRETAALPLAGPAPKPNPSPLTRRELGLFLAGMLALVGGQLTATGAWSLFARHFWLDELFTYTIVSEPDLGRSMQALASGIDTHPPALYLTLRVLTLGGVFASEITLRAAVLGFMLAALVGLYVSLRDSFRPLACVAACLAVWSHPAIVSQAFEARFYGAWIAGAVWYAYVLRRVRGGSGIGLKLALAALAVFVCTVHYFGIISLAAITACEFLTPRAASGRVRALVPAALGPVGLAACLPLLMQQRAAYSVPTWVPPATWGAAVDFVATLLMPSYVLIAVIAAVAWGRLTGCPKAPAGAILPQTGLLGLALVPLVLVAFSFAVQSVLVYRYGIPAVAALAPLVAWALSATSRGPVLACCGLFLFMGGWELRDHAADKRRNDAAYQQFAAVLAALPGDRLVVFEDAHHIFVLDRYHPELSDRCRLLDFDEHDPPTAELGVVVRDLVRQYVRFYSSPVTMPWSAVSRLPRFYLVVRTWANPEVPLDHYYPGFTPRHIQGQLHEMIADEP